MDNMFCFQCEQTSASKACMGVQGVCGKKGDTAIAQDKLTGALVGLARLTEGSKPDFSTYQKMLEGLFTTVTNVNFDTADVERQINEAHEEQRRIIALHSKDVKPGELDLNMNALWFENEDIRSLKSLILFGLRGMAAYAYHALALGHTDDEVNEFIRKGLLVMGDKMGMTELLTLVLETGRVNLKCMEMLDKANTGTYGTPVPTVVPLTVEKGPFIVVSGHDLHDLYLLLEQTKDKGINIYTHGEMLPAHAYPMLKAYPQLKGNFGTAWQNQQKEFAAIPGPVLFTTNCIMPVKDSYHDRIFTTAMVAYPEMVHIGEDKDFTPVIEKALALGGYPEPKALRGINGGTTMTTGFGHGTVLSVADKVVEAVKSGEIKHFFLVGGCDGAKPGRNYYTDFVAKAPKDSVILTLACGKFRFNDMDLGTIAGLPRIMDMGQCNDSYSAIRVAVALAEAFNCSVNELPLTLILSWYEQKAVAVLLTLLHLGIKNIHIGPTLPAFISPNVLNVLVSNYDLTPISTAEADLKKILD